MASEIKSRGQIAAEAYVKAYYERMGRPLLLKWEDEPSEYRAVWEDVARALDEDYLASLVPVVSPDTSGHDEASRQATLNRSGFTDNRNPFKYGKLS